MGEESGEETGKRKARGKLVKLLRLGIVVGTATWLIKKKRARSTPAEGLWRDGETSGGPGSGRKS